MFKEREIEFSGANEGKNERMYYKHNKNGAMQDMVRGPFAIFIIFWQNRKLVGRLVRREIEGRYRGSIFGLFWSFAQPILLLAVYSFVFGMIFRSRWDSTLEHKGTFPIILFAGLNIFNFYADCFNRAPGLFLENTSYIKRVVFPLEVLPLVSIASSLFFNLIIGGIVFMFFYLFFFGVPPWTIIMLPLVLLPLVLLNAALSWFLASTGVFIRDLKQLVGVLTTLSLFTCPLFYPLSAIPENIRQYIYFNPLSFILEQARAVMFWKTMPDWPNLIAAFLVAFSLNWLGYAWFIKTRKGFADVV